MTRLFGTDGVRGLANRDVTVELAVRLGAAAAQVLGRADVRSGIRPRAIVGRDPRASGEMLAAAVSAGLASEGVDVLDVGVVPTPAVAYLASTLPVELGVMISASHNPMQDNGIKFFDRSGFKLPDTLEDEIEARTGQDRERPTGAGVGRITVDPDAVQAYVDHLVESTPGSLDGMHVVVDCAHGAASTVGPEALRRAGADVVVIGAEPDGVNINDDYGATRPRRMAAATVGHAADAGVSFDGDADRCIAADENGEVVDGDQIMGIITAAEHERGRLRGSTLVATVMSNLGLARAMEQIGVTTVRTAVGDRYVLEEMRRGGFSVGGEQSGHVVLLNHATTGDGILTALHLLAQLAQGPDPLSVLAARVPHLPQSLVNVPGVDKARASSDPGLMSAVAEVERELGAGGRVLLRASGTESLVRVMVEAPTQQQADACADRLAAVVRDRLSLR